ncbi:MAG: hypothetical protein H0X39_19500 [Actinobacteria bacterium]|nr:hypothetical protein [Actinomycetota bacterium]
MSLRRVFGDETWRLARSGDAPALHLAADLLRDGDPNAHGYDGHRARAFALALEGDLDGGLAELRAGRTDDWPFPAALAADRTRVRYLAGDLERALEELRPAVRGVRRLDPEISDLVSALVVRAPQLRLRAVRLVLEGGTAWQRMRNAATTLAAR